MNDDWKHGDDIVGEQDDHGNITIHVPASCSLYAGQGVTGALKYLPCDSCGIVSTVRLNVVSYCCSACYEGPPCDESGSSYDAKLAHGAGYPT